MSGVRFKPVTIGGQTGYIAHLGGKGYQACINGKLVGGPHKTESAVVRNAQSIDCHRNCKK